MKIPLISHTAWNHSLGWHIILIRMESTNFIHHICFSYSKYITTFYCFSKEWHGLEELPSEQHILSIEGDFRCAEWKLVSLLSWRRKEAVSSLSSSLCGLLRSSWTNVCNADPRVGEPTGAAYGQLRRNAETKWHKHNIWFISQQPNFSLDSKSLVMPSVLFWSPSLIFGQNPNRLCSCWTSFPDIPLTCLHTDWNKAVLSSCDSKSWTTHCTLQPSVQRMCSCVVRTNTSLFSVPATSTRPWRVLLTTAGRRSVSSGKEVGVVVTFAQADRNAWYCSLVSWLALMLNCSEILNNKRVLVSWAAFTWM